MEYLKCGWSFGASGKYTVLKLHMTEQIKCYDFLAYFSYISYIYKGLGKTAKCQEFTTFFSVATQSVAFKEIVHKLHFLYCCSQCILTGEL